MEEAKNIELLHAVLSQCAVYDRTLTDVDCFIKFMPEGF